MLQLVELATAAHSSLSVAEKQCVIPAVLTSSSSSGGTDLLGIKDGPISHLSPPLTGLTLKHLHAPLLEVDAEKEATFLNRAMQSGGRGLLEGPPRGARGVRENWREETQYSILCV